MPKKLTINESHELCRKGQGKSIFWAIDYGNAFALFFILAYVSCLLFADGFKNIQSVILLVVVMLVAVAIKEFIFRQRLVVTEQGIFFKRIVWCEFSGWTEKKNRWFDWSEIVKIEYRCEYYGRSCVLLIVSKANKYPYFVRMSPFRKKQLNTIADAISQNSGREAHMVHVRGKDYDIVFGDKSTLGQRVAEEDWETLEVNK